MTITIDLTKYDTGKPNWLSPVERNRPLIEAARARKRALAKAADSMNAVNQKIEALEKRLKDRA